MAQMKKVKTAVVGCGMISNIYLKNFANHMFYIIDLVAVADAFPESAKRQAEKYGVPKVMTVDEVMASDEIELIVNLTPPFAHYSVIKQALESGKHVYTEKMMCVTMEQAREVVELAANKGLYLGCAPDIFLGAGLQTARKAIDMGMIGTVTSVNVALNRDHAMCSEYFSFIKKEGGAFPYDVGVYFISALLALFGPVSHVAGFTKKSPLHEGVNFWNGNYGESWELEGSNLVTAVLQFENGILANVHMDGNSVNESQELFTVYGTEGILKVGDPGGYAGRNVLIRKGGESCELPFTHGYKGTPLYGEPMPLDWGGHRGLGAAEMAWSIRQGRTNRASKEMALHTMEVLDGIDIASQQKIVYQMTTSFEQPQALPSGYIGTEMGMRADSEMSLVK